jgi:allophanate hydrolase
MDRPDAQLIVDEYKNAAAILRYACHRGLATLESIRNKYGTRAVRKAGRFALPGTTPPKPGLVRVAEGGASIEVEVWAVPVAGYGAFVSKIPAPLGIGTIALEDGSTVQGFLCEPVALDGARDITRFGGWRAFLAAC